MKTNRGKYYLFFVLTLVLMPFFLLSCSKDDQITQPDNSPKAAIPLNIGNDWIYSVTEYDLVSQEIVMIDTIERKINADTTYKGVRWFRYNSIYGESGANFSDGYWMMYINQNNVYEKYLQFKYPCELNDTNKCFLPDYNEMFAFSVKQTSIVVSTSAGTFYCYKYEALSKTHKIDFYLTPNKGIIKEIVYKIKPNTETYQKYQSIELEKYTLIK